MSDLFYVVNTITGVRYEPGYPTKGQALLAAGDKTAECDDDIPGRFDVECGSPDVWAHAIPCQQNGSRS